MNALALARDAYGAPQAPTRTARHTEYDLIARSTAALRRANDARRSDFPGLVRALHANRQVWTALAADVGSEGNALPDMLRARLIYLAEFTMVHSRKILAGEAEAGPLIEINTAVMRGLSGDGAS